jgi:hypothetical protein
MSLPIETNSNPHMPSRVKTSAHHKKGQDATNSCTAISEHLTETFMSRLHTSRWSKTSGLLLAPSKNNDLALPEGCCTLVDPVSLDGHTLLESMWEGTQNNCKVFCSQLTVGTPRRHAMPSLSHPREVREHPGMRSTLLTSRIVLGFQHQSNMRISAGHSSL